MRRALHDLVPDLLALPRALSLLPIRRRDARRAATVGPVPDLAVASWSSARIHRETTELALSGLRRGIYSAHRTTDDGVLVLTPDRRTASDVRRHPLVRMGRTIHPRIDADDVDPLAVALAVLSTPPMPRSRTERIVAALDVLASIEADAVRGHLDGSAVAVVAVAPTPWAPAVTGQAAGPVTLVEARQDAPARPLLRSTAPTVDPASVGVPVCASVHVTTPSCGTGSILVGPLHGTWVFNPFAPSDRPDLDPMEVLRTVDRLRRGLAS